MKNINLTKTSVKTVSLNCDQLYVINNDKSIRKQSTKTVNLGYLVETNGKNINIYNLS